MECAIPVEVRLATEHADLGLLERAVEAALPEVGDRLWAEVVARLEASTPVPATCPACGAPMKANSRAPRRLVTLAGEVELSRRRYRRTGCGAERLPLGEAPGPGDSRETLVLSRVREGVGSATVEPVGGLERTGDRRPDHGRATSRREPRRAREALSGTRASSSPARPRRFHPCPAPRGMLRALPRRAVQPTPCDLRLRLLGAEGQLRIVRCHTTH